MLCPVTPPLDDPRCAAADIPPNVLLHLTELAAARGMPCDSWFVGLGLTREALSDPAMRVSYRQAGAVIRRALRSFELPDLGLRVGRNETPGSFGLLGLAMMTARDFGEAMRVGVEHHKVCGALLEVGFEQLDGREVALTAWPRFHDPELLPFLCEELFASSLAVARQLIGPTFRPNGIELSYPAPAHAAAYREVFGCEARFGAACNRIRLDATWLAQALPGHNPLTARQALALCTQQQSRDGAETTIVATVERLLRGRLRQSPTIGEVARDLHLSERSLRRRLAANGRPFREIHDRVRAERALQLLQAGALSVAEVGSAVGFDDPREFRRAFKRWTGMPPRAARRVAA